ncbi:PHP domain-containing protein [bacterium]|nr:PHP domain-containing protein [bacterium]
MAKFIDLHIHSTHSDGLLTPIEIIRKVAEHNLSAIAITDHDSISAYDEAAQEARRLNIELISGVELSCETEGRDIHILGYFVDGKNDAFIKFLEKMRYHRKKRIFKIAEKLNFIGIDFCAESLLKELKNASPGRLHVARKLLKDGKIKSIYEAFRCYIGENCPAYVKKFKLNINECIDLIHSIGGIAVMAHPGIYKMDHLIDIFKNYGLDGLEIFHSEHKSHQTKKYRKIAEENNLLVTGGSDYHGVQNDGRVLGALNIPYSLLEHMKEKLQEKNRSSIK